MPSVFICYSHEDEEWRDRLLKYLNPLNLDKQIVWSDLDLEPGDIWDEKIKEVLPKVTLAVVLVSQTLLNSTYVRNEELPRLLKRFEEKAVRIIPLFVEYADVDNVPFYYTNEQGVRKTFYLNQSQSPSNNSPDQPLYNLLKPEQDKILLSVAQTLRSLIKKDKQKVEPNPTPSPPTKPEENLDITLELALTDEQMSTGTRERILTERGSITVTIPAGVSLGDRIPVIGKGKLEPVTQRRGDLYLLITERDEEIGNIEEKAPKNSNFTEDLGNGITLDMVYIQGGSFMMGSNEYKREQPIHRVELKEFYLSKYPITQAQYQAIMGPNPSRFQGVNNPVERVSWYDAQEFCEQLSAKTGKQYKLPSEAQWEYACRAGSDGKWCFGDDESKLKDYARYGKNSNAQTHPVGEKEPNQWGLYDMHGNVWEWCADSWHNNYKKAPTDGSAWLKDGNDNRSPLRGGSWAGIPDYCRSASRNNNIRRVDRYYDVIGFRVVCGFGRTL